MAKRSRSSVDPGQEDSKRKKVETWTSIKVTGLSPTIPQSWLESTFKHYGEITNTEHSKEEGTAYIHFKTDEAAHTACQEMNGETVEDKALSVEIHQSSLTPCTTYSAAEVPSKLFSFKLADNVDTKPATAPVQSSTIDFKNLPSLPKAGAQSLFNPVRRGFDLTAAHSAMVNTLPQQTGAPVKPQSTVTVMRADQLPVSSSESKDTGASMTPSPHLPTRNCHNPSRDPQSLPSVVGQRGKAMEIKATSKPTKKAPHVLSKIPPPPLKHTKTHPPATLISSTSSDNQKPGLGNVSKNRPAIIRCAQTEHAPSLSTTKEVAQHETTTKVDKKDASSAEGDSEGNPFKQALSHRPSLALPKDLPSRSKPEKQVMAMLSEVVEFSHPMNKRIIVSKYKSELKALQSKYKVSIRGEEVVGVALTLSGSSAGNVMQAKRELKALEQSIQAKISDSMFTLSCGFLPCLANTDTVTSLQAIEKQDAVEFAIVTSNHKVNLTQCCEIIKGKLAEMKGPLCLSQVHSFTEMRLGYFWKVRNATSGEVVGFEPDINDQINEAYIGRKSTCSFFYKTHSYTIDFSQMTVSDLTLGGQTHTLVREPVWCRYTSEEFGYEPLRESISSIIECTFQQGAPGYINIEGDLCVIDFNSSPMQAHSVGVEGESCFIQRQPQIVPSTCVAPALTVKVRGIADTLSSVETKFCDILKRQVTTDTLSIPPRLSNRVTQLLILGMARQYCVQCVLTEGLQLMGTKEMVKDVSKALLQEILGLMSECEEPSQPSTPPNWAPQTKDVELCPVSEGSPEWVHIDELMKESLKDVKIRTIDRIQNKHLWQRYDFFRKSLAKRMNGKSINEKELFHGTRSNPPNTIYESDKGFDFRFASENSLWGQGIYFAVNASYSDHGYAYCLSGGEKQLILAKVVTGESMYMSARKKMSVPPLKPGETSERYDTVSATTGGSEIYVVYDHEKAYPAYIISYVT